MVLKCYDGKNLNELQTKWKTNLVQLGLIGEKIEVDKQVPLIIQALKNTIAGPEAAWLFAPRASTQTELSITTMDDNNQPREHRIDLTFIENNERFIIDFKLGLEVTEANAKIVAQAQHTDQLARYATLFLHENLPIKKAILFLSIGKLVNI